MPHAGKHGSFPKNVAKIQMKGFHQKVVYCFLRMQIYTADLDLSVSHVPTSLETAYDFPKEIMAGPTRKRIFMISSAHLSDEGSPAQSVPVPYG